MISTTIHEKWLRLEACVGITARGRATEVILLGFSPKRICFSHIQTALENKQ